MKFALGIKKINKSYIDQTSSVRMVEVWPRSKAKKNWLKSSYLDVTLGQ